MAKKIEPGKRRASNAPGLTERVTVRGEIRYDAVYRAPDGRERSRTFKTKREADQWRRAQLAALDRGSFFDPRSGRVTLREWADEWVRTSVDLRESTNDIHERNLRLHVLPTLGDIELSKLTTLGLRGWLAELAAKPIQSPRADGSDVTKLRSASTTHQAYRTLHRLLSAAVETEMISRNPLVGVKPPKIDDDEMQFITASEVARLADTIDERYRALVLVANCGLRASELVGLRRNRIDFTKNRISIVEQISERSNGRGFVVGPPKTTAGRREVPLPGFVAEVLTEHMSRWSESSPTGLVFPAPAGGPIRWRSWSTRFWQPAVARAELDGLRPHDLRHTCASLAIASGADVKVIQRMLGHASATMTLDRYGHLFPDRLDDIASRLDEVARNAATEATTQTRMSQQHAV
jgi:integrase